MLALHTIARGKEVLVSRSELVEIGGGFRVPEIMEASGCRLVEVGTTNKTRIGDYARKAKPKESLLLKVHQSNFVQSGFVESVTLTELAALGRRLRLPVVYDNGAGQLSTIEENLADGADIVVASADKLFGSIQAGLIAGRAPFVEKMRTNPLYRALRLDKVRLALLHHTLMRYLGGAQNEIPSWQMVTRELDSCRDRLRLPAGVEWVKLKAQTGGGSNPEENMDSLGLCFSRGSAKALKEKFATRPIPILGYIQGNRFTIDVRTLFPDDFHELQKALDELVAAG